MIETSEEDKIRQIKDKMQTYVQLAVADKLDTFLPGYYHCTCFATYIRLSQHEGIVGQAAKLILSELVWYDCPNPRCPECSDGLYSEIQKWRKILEK